MALKEDLKYIKEEISTEEQFMENFLKLEKFFKKYKVLLIVSILLIVGAFGGYKFYTYIDEQKIVEANGIYLSLIEKPDDPSLLASLKDKNKNLYELYVISEALKSSDAQIGDISINNKILKDLVEYTKATTSGDLMSLKQYSNNSEALMGDFAILQEAYLLLKENKIEEGRELLNKIGFQSPLVNIANFLKHYTIKGGK